LEIVFNTEVLMIIRLILSPEYAEKKPEVSILNISINMHTYHKIGHWYFAVFQV